MKKKLTIRLGLLLFYFAFAVNCQHDKNSGPPIENNEPKEKSAPSSGRIIRQSLIDEPLTKGVYICDSSGAKRYHHSENCTGLRHCTHTIVKTTVAKAQDLGLTLCSYEY